MSTHLEPPIRLKGNVVSAKVTVVRVLLVSSDIQIIDTLCQFMEQMAMHVEVCSDINSAARKLCHTKFEAVAVDFKNPAEALELIKKPREMTSHKVGITGWAQVNGLRGDTSISKRIEYDLYYLQNWGFMFAFVMLPHSPVGCRGQRNGRKLKSRRELLLVFHTRSLLHSLRTAAYHAVLGNVLSVLCWTYC